MVEKVKVEEREGGRLGRREMREAGLVLRGSLMIEMNNI